MLPHVLLKADLLLDGSGGAPLHNAAVRIDSERITAVGSAEQFGETTDDLLDLGKACLLPGLIEMHGHLRLSHLEPEPSQQINDDEASYIVKAAEHLRVNLHSGVTTMRC